MSSLYHVHTQILCIDIIIIMAALVTLMFDVIGNMFITNVVSVH